MGIMEKNGARLDTDAIVIPTSVILATGESCVEETDRMLDHGVVMMSAAKDGRCFLTAGDSIVAEGRVVRSRRGAEFVVERAFGAEGAGR